MQEVSSRRTPTLIRWALFVAVTILSFAVVFIPAWLIQPFKSQNAEDLRVSYALRHWSPTITVVGIAAALLIAFRLWRAQRWWGKTAICLLFVPLIFSAWFARQNHFEWMFKPLPNASFVQASEADFVSDSEMVLAVELNGDAVAYPVRQIAYHHVVQDVVGGIPIVATY